MDELKKRKAATPRGLPAFFKKFLTVGAPEHYQRILFAPLERTEFEEIIKAAPKVMRTRIESATGTGANYWLTQHPSEWIFTLPDGDFLAALRHLLGLPPSKNFPKQCPFPSCTSKKEEQIENDHLHNCPYLRGSVVTDRHNRLTRTLGVLSREVGMHWWEEPRVHGSKERGERPDAIASAHDGRVMVDLSVINPTARTYKGGKIGRAAARETDKRTKYSALAAQMDCDFVPFVVESYGTVGPSALAFLKLIASQSANEWADLEEEDVKKAERAHLQRTLRAISFALQSGNAHVSRVGSIRMGSHT